MKSTRLWIADPETSYAEALQDYINLRQSHLFQAVACTDKDQLKVIFQEKKSGILLLSSRWREKGMRIPKRLCVILLSDGDTAGDLTKYPVLYKYQSAQVLVREMMYHYSERENEGSYVTGTRRNNKVIGVFSPAGESGKTLFALTMGQLLARERNVLYLNMEECSGFMELFGRSQWNLSDLVYFLRQNKTQFFYRISAMVQKLGAMDFIPPCETYTDFRQITTEEWKKMISFIRTQSEYDYLILDIGIISGHEIDLLRQCDGIYMPVSNASLPQAKDMQWIKYLQSLDAMEIESKLLKVVLPVCERMPECKEDFVMLTQQKLGMYIRNLLKEQES